MDNSGKEKEALALIAEAEKKTKSSQSFFASMFGGSSKLEEACEMYIRAANMFKMAKNWSAKHHVSIAEIYESELVDIDKASVCVCVCVCVSGPPALWGFY
ncbi:UNVERIFIED_CONTAM: hypothetical protein FKN15_040992 [Acipenser sinensis]